jgi:hypothetical protein
LAEEIKPEDIYGKGFEKKALKATTNYVWSDFRVPIKGESYLNNSLHIGVSHYWESDTPLPQIRGDRYVRYFTGPRIILRKKES